MAPRGTPLAERAWPAVPAGALLAVPLGSTEQHGPDLPLGTDTLVADALVGALAATDDRVAAAPALPFGASGEHAGFPGTLSIGTEALAVVLVELVRSADAFAGVVLVSAHGGNARAVATAAATACAEGRRVLAWSPSAGRAGAAAGRPADAHAGWLETSLVLALRPDLVGPGRTAGERRPLGELAAALRAGGVASVSPCGVLGDPAGADAAAGTAVLAAWAADLAGAVAAWAPR